jgi:hypothetical protein
MPRFQAAPIGLVPGSGTGTSSKLADVVLASHHGSATQSHRCCNDIQRIETMARHRREESANLIDGEALADLA